MAELDPLPVLQEGAHSSATSYEDRRFNIGLLLSKSKGGRNEGSSEQSAGALPAFKFL